MDRNRDRDVDVPLKVDAADEKAEASGGTSLPLIINPLLRRRHVLPGGRFLGPAPQFASAGITAGYLRVRVAVVVPPADRPAASSQDKGGKEILVLYRYTHFSAVPGGVEVCKSTKLHELRFAVPPAGDAAGSLMWAGSSLAPLIYPAHHTKALQALWSRLVSQVSVPPEATRVHVIADVGILRREDYTRRRMERVRAALAGMMAEPWPGYHVAMELRLPEPVHMQCADEAETVGGEDTEYCEECERPKKRRKIVTEEGAGQECPVCFEPLENDAAAWPGCSLPHVFHGACLEETLKESEKCPICRRRLSSLDEQV
ncbi:hypothetical protein VPH35_010141 [Triticum aestivum]